VLVKCKICSQKVDRDDAYKVEVSGKNNYYCNENEYKNLIQQKQDKDNVYTEINDIFGRKITNTAIFKEITEISKIYTYERILAYLKFNNTYLGSVMAKDFSSEYAQIRYFSAILKNSLSDFKIENNLYDKEIVIDIPKDNFKQKKQKKTLADFEMEEGEDL